MLRSGSANYTTKWFFITLLLSITSKNAISYKSDALTERILNFSGQVQIPWCVQSDYLLPKS